MLSNHAIVEMETFTNITETNARTTEIDDVARFVNNYRNIINILSEIRI